MREFDRFIPCLGRDQVVWENREDGGISDAFLASLHRPNLEGSDFFVADRLEEGSTADKQKTKKKKKKKRAEEAGEKSFPNEKPAEDEFLPFLNNITISL